jgi:hypothetical protein
VAAAARLTWPLPADTAIEAQHPDQIAGIPVAQFAQVLQPLCAQLREVAGASKRDAAAGSSSAEGGAGGSAAAADAEKPAAAGASRPKLPVRAARADGAGGSASRAVSARSASAETWTELCGPNDAADVQEYRQSLQKLREDLCRMFLKIGFPLSNLHLRQTLHRLKVSEMQVAPFSPTRPNMDEAAKAAAQEAEGSLATLSCRLVVVVIGLAGAGKTSLIHRLLDLPPVGAFDCATTKCRIIDGEARGIPVRFIDTPGLEIGFDAQQTNRFKMIGAAPLASAQHVHVCMRARFDVATGAHQSIRVSCEVGAHGCVASRRANQCGCAVRIALPCCAERGACRF